jgi:hypothetical protein
MDVKQTLFDVYLDQARIKLLRGEKRSNNVVMRVESATLQPEGSDENDDKAVPEDPNLTFHDSLASLNLCDAQHPKYYCENDITCSNSTCIHQGLEARYGDPDNWKRFWRLKNERRQVLQHALTRMEVSHGPNPSKRLFLMTFNIGFAHLFGNWYCSLLRNGVDVASVKRYTLIIATDAEAVEYANKLGFFSLTLHEINVIKAWTNLRFTRKAAPNFSHGSHGGLNLLLKFAMPLDLVHLGYSVMLQDVDIIWVQNAFEIVPTYCAEGCDAVFIHEKRPYISWKSLSKTVHFRRNTTFPYPGYPEANTGMFFLKANQVTEDFLKVLIQANKLQQFKNRDQLLYNALLFHKAFQAFNFDFLPERRFVPGKYTRADHFKATNYTMPVAPELVAIHVSDTANFIRKYHRLQFINHWYFNESICPEPVKLCESVKRCWIPIETILQDQTEKLGNPPAESDNRN